MMPNQHIPTTNREAEEFDGNWEKAEHDIAPAFKVSKIGEFLKKKIPPRELLLAPWLPRQGLAMVYAPRGVGKTHFALEVAVALATGGEFLGWKAPKAVKVLYIDGEMPSADLQTRLKQIQKRTGSIPGDNLRIMTPDEQSGAMPDLSDPCSLARLKHFTDVDLVVVDNISTLCRTGNENEAESWRITEGWALRLRAEGKSVLFVHHSGKAGGQRGTSKREDTLDTVIALKHPDDYKQSDGARFEVHFEKARGFSGEDAEPIEAMLAIEEKEGYQWKWQRKEDAVLGKIKKLHSEGLNQTEIAEQLGVSKATMSRKMQYLKAKGKLD